MLAALEERERVPVWYALMDKVYRANNLVAAWEKVQANRGAAGVDRQSVGAFGAHAEQYLAELHDALRTGTYRAQAVRRCHIPKEGTATTRPLGIPTVKDRIVQTALKHVAEPIWETRFHTRSYGFRPGRGCKDALREVDRLLHEGCVWVVDADIQAYFDSIDKKKLMEDVKEVMADGAVLRLIEQYLHQGVLEEGREWTPEHGTPQGAVISPLLANIYLHPVDEALGAAGHEHVRYADDLVILCRSREEAEGALTLLRNLLAGRGLTLHPEKTRIVDAREPGGFDFLGYHFERGMRWPRKKAEQRWRTRIRDLTRRTSGTSMATTIARVNAVTRGWYEYFKHSHHTTFAKLDGWMRMRLRSILRKWHKTKGRGGGCDHLRWPNAYFTKLGLFTMSAAHATACQSR
jgi:RNA-directed DNA polymerase